MIDCPRCGGTGALLWASPDAEQWRDAFEECELCTGIGKLVVELRPPTPEEANEARLT